MDIQKYFPDTTTVKFVEIHKTEPTKQESPIAKD